MYRYSKRESIDWRDSLVLSPKNIIISEICPEKGIIHDREAVSMHWMQVLEIRKMDGHTLPLIMEEGGPKKKLMDRNIKPSDPYGDENKPMA